MSYQYAIYKYSTDIFSYSPEFKQFCPLERLRNNDNEHSRLWSSKPFPTKKQFLEKWLITDLGQEGYNLNLEHLGISENKKVVKWKDLMYLNPDLKTNIKLQQKQINETQN